MGGSSWLSTLYAGDAAANLSGLPRLPPNANHSHVGSPMILISNGCGGSTITQAILRKLLFLHRHSTHGDFEALKLKGNKNPTDEKLCKEEASKYKSPTDLCMFRALLRKPHAAVASLAGADTGYVFHAFTKSEPGSLHVPSFVRTMAAADVKAVVLSRNPLDSIACEVRDCFRQCSGCASVDAHGNRSTLCFKRRFQPEQPNMAHLPVSSQLLEFLAREERKISPNLLNSGGLRADKIARISYEALTAWEYEGPGLEWRITRSLEEAKKALRSFGVEPVDSIISAYFRSNGAGARRRTPQSASIHNYEAVAAFLRANGRGALLRDVPKAASSLNS